MSEQQLVMALFVLYLKLDAALDRYERLVERIEEVGRTIQ